MQAEKEETTAAADTAAGKPPSICDRLQRAFHARPAFRPLRRLTVRHQDGDGGAAKLAGDAPGGPAPKHSGPPVPAPPQPLAPPPPAPAGGAPAAAAPRPVPVRLPAVAEKKAAASAPPGPPVPVPPPDVKAGMVTAADAEEAGDKAPQTNKGKPRVGSRVRKAFSSK